jgi:N-acetylmuramoyl-L-alanine amidase
MKNLNKLRLGLLLLSLTVGFSLAFMPDLFADKKNHRESGVRTIVIDPGHGGHDSGCHGAGSYEKNVALAVSLKLGKLIEANFPDVKVIYTRKTDVFVELYRRAQIANENKADLFICIHCNSGPKAAFGAETFVMGLHKTDDNLNVAKRENAVILQEDNYQRKYDGFDPNSAEANIIFSLYQNAFLDQSVYFADRLQHEFKHYASRHNRGVKQAGFLVLFRTTMPSVLIETGFLTNGEEEKYLKSNTGQQKIANAILRALNTYKSWIDGSSEIHDLKLPDDEQRVEQKEDKEVEQNSAAHVEKSSDNKNESGGENIGIIYRIQVYTSPEKVSLKSARFKGRADVWEYSFNKSWKYTVGRCDKQEDALKLLSELKKAGFDDAFVVAFKNNKRISLQEAQLIQPN